MEPKIHSVVCVALHPAVDRVIEVESIAVGEHVKGRTTTRHPAGKAVNVARILGKLGHPAMLTGFIGADEAHWFEQFVNADGVKSQLFSVPGATRENITLIAKDHEQELHVRDVGHAIRGEDLERLAAKLRLLAKEGVALVLSGSLPPGMSKDDFVGLIRTGNEAGADVVVDAGGPAAAAAARERLLLIKPNHAELETMVGHPVAEDAERIAACRELTKRVGMVLLSLGADGAMLIGRRTALAGRIDVRSSEIRNTVGCGDALLAGMLAGLLEGLANRDALARALAVATAAAVQTASGDINAARLEEFAAKAEVRDLGN